MSERWGPDVPRPIDPQRAVRELERRLGNVEERVEDIERRVRGVEAATDVQRVRREQVMRDEG